LQPVRIDEGWTVIPGDDESAFRDWIHRDDFKHPTSSGAEPALGSHLLIELYGCDPSTLEGEEFVREAMEEAAVRSEATVVTSSFHEFKPYGVSGAVIIQESHYTIHTWPEYRYAAIDLFYCGDGVAVDKAVEAVQEHFKPSRTRFLVVRRGLQSEVEVK
jgi:S-adenosylmethionine decarboxylase